MITDDFSGTLSHWTDQNWTPGSPPGIVGGVAFSSANLAFAAMYWSANTWNDNQRMKLTVRNAITYGGPAVRSTGTSASTINLYTYSAHGSLQKFINGSQIVLGVTPPTAAVNDSIELDVTSATLTTYRNGSIGVSTTDGAISSGNGGIQWFHNTMGADDVVGTGEKINSTYTLVAVPGTFSAGFSLGTLRAARVATASSGTYSYAGTNAFLRFSVYNLVALSTTFFAVSASEAALRRVPIDLDAVATGTNGGSGTLTFAHTCNGPLRVLLVGIVGDPAADDLTSVTYNNVAMTLIDKVANAAGSRWAYLYQLVGPAIGTHDVRVTSTGSHLLVGVSASYMGLRQSAQPVNHSATTTGSNAQTYTTSLTPTVANCWVMLLSAGYNANTNDPSAGTGAVRRVNDITFGLEGLFDSDHVAAAGSPYSMTTTRANVTYPMVHFMVSLVAGGVANVLTGDPGTYAWTGTTATLRAGYRASATSGSYTGIGTAARLLYNRHLVVTTTTVTVTGTVASLRATRALAAASGTYAWTGTAARLAVGRALEAGSGSYTFLGTAATLTRSGAGGFTYTLNASSGSYATTGTAASLVLHRVLSPVAGHYTVTGTAAILRATRLLTAAANAYALTGTAARLKLGRGFAAAGGVYLWTTTNARLVAHRKVVADAGAYVLTGTVATLKYRATDVVPADLVATVFQVRTTVMMTAER